MLVDSVPYCLLVAQIRIHMYACKCKHNNMSTHRQQGGLVIASACSVTRNTFAGFVSLGEKSTVHVTNSSALENGHTGAGVYQNGMIMITGSKFDNNFDAGVHVVGTGSIASVSVSTVNNNRVGFFVQDGGFISLYACDVSHSQESGLVTRGPATLANVQRSSIRFSQVFGCVAEEASRIRITRTNFKHNLAGGASATDFGSQLWLCESTICQCGRGLYLLDGATCEAEGCVLERNEITGTTVYGPGSMLVYPHLIQNDAIQTSSLPCPLRSADANTSGDERVPNRAQHARSLQRQLGIHHDVRLARSCSAFHCRQHY